MNKFCKSHIKRNIFLIVALILLAIPTFSQTIEAGVTFDWISKTQFQRDENISQIQQILFNEKTILKYPKKEFKSKLETFLKDSNSRQNYIDIKNGKKEDAICYYAGFYSNNGLFLAYGIQYKNNMKNIYYYDALGNLRFIDFYSESYPKFPYYALQYDVSGKLIGTIYFVSTEDQYIYNPDKSFKGRWYKEKMYNRNAKVIMNRSNY